MAIKRIYVTLNRHNMVLLGADGALVTRPNSSDAAAPGPGQGALAPAGPVVDDVG